MEGPPNGLLSGPRWYPAVPLICDIAAGSSRGETGSGCEGGCYAMAVVVRGRLFKGSEEERGRNERPAFRKSRTKGLEGGRIREGIGGYGGL
jgi:hypothetical protein